MKSVTIAIILTAIMQQCDYDCYDQDCTNHSGSGLREAWVRPSQAGALNMTCRGPQAGSEGEQTARWTRERACTRSYIVREPRKGGLICVGWVRMYVSMGVGELCVQGCGGDGA